MQVKLRIHFSSYSASRAYRFWFTLSFMLLGAAAAHSQSPPPGTYILNGGYGELDIFDQGGVSKFRIQTAGSGGSFCTAEGNVNGEEARTASADNDCSIRMQYDRLHHAISTESNQTCQHCGAGAEMDGKFFLTRDICSTLQPKPTEDRVRKLLLAGQYNRATKMAEAFLKTCKNRADDFSQWRVRILAARSLKLQGKTKACWAMAKPAVDSIEQHFDKPTGHDGWRVPERGEAMSILHDAEDVERACRPNGCFLDQLATVDDLVDSIIQTGGKHSYVSETDIDYHRSSEWQDIGLLLICPTRIRGRFAIAPQGHPADPSRVFGNEQPFNQ